LGRNQLAQRGTTRGAVERRLGAFCLRRVERSEGLRRKEGRVAVDMLWVRGRSWRRVWGKVEMDGRVDVWMVWKRIIVSGVVKS